MDIRKGDCGVYLKDKGDWILNIGLYLYLYLYRHPIAYYFLPYSKGFHPWALRSISVPSPDTSLRPSVSAVMWPISFMSSI